MIVLSCFRFFVCMNKCYRLHKLHGCCRLFQTTIKNYEDPHLKSTNLSRIQVTTLTCCNIQVKQHHCTMLATATGNCDVTNVTYSEKHYVVTWIISSPRCTCADASEYIRSLLCHIACWFRCGEVLKFEQFYQSNFF